MQYLNQQKKDLTFFFGEKQTVFIVTTDSILPTMVFTILHWILVTVDYGRFRVTLDDKDIAKFKTPTLRNIEKTFLICMTADLKRLKKW